MYHNQIQYELKWFGTYKIHLPVMIKCVYLMVIYLNYSANPMAERDRKKSTREGNKLKDR